jgi:PAS domain S-box-containing protein
MGLLNILIEDSVGDQLGYPEPLSRLEDFLRPDCVALATELLSSAQGTPVPVVCLDVNCRTVEGLLTAKRSGNTRFVSLHIGIQGELSRYSQAPPSGALADGTVLWRLDVRNAEIHVEHKSGSADELVSFTTHFESWLNTVHPDDRDLLDSQVQAAIATGSDIHTVVRVIRSDGDERIVEAFGRAVVRDDVTFEVVGMSIDVTSRDAAVRAMADQSARLELTLAASGMGAWDWDIVSGLVTWSDRVAEIFGTTLEAFSGGVEEYESFIHPDDLESARAAVVDCLEGKVSKYVVAHRIVRPDGGVRWLEASGSLLRGENGEPIRLLGMVWDTTFKRQQEEQYHRMEQDLERASDRFRLASESAGIALWEVDLRNRVHTWDSQMCLLFAHDADQYVGPADLWMKAVHPEDRDQALNELLQSIEFGHGTSNFRIILPDGQIRHILSFGQVISDAKGPRLVGLCMDVSQRQESQVRERNRNKVLEALVSSAPVQEVLSVLVQVLEEEDPRARIGFMLVDPSGRFLENASAPSMSADFMAAADHLEILEGNGSCGSAASLRMPVVVEDIQTHPYWSAFRDIAKESDIGACWSIPIFGPGDRLFGTLGVYFSEPRKLDEDILRRLSEAADFAALAIERKNSEVALRNRELLLQSMGEIAGVGGWEVDLRNGHRIWTEEMYRIHGMREASDGWIGVQQLYTYESRMALEQAVSHTTETGEPWSLELELETPAGRHVWIRSEGRSQSAAGKVVRLFGAAQDITSIKQAEYERVALQEQLLHAQKMESVGRLAGGVAHDFNNIVSVILGHAELAMETAPEGSELMQDLNEIRLAAERSATLTKQLLAFARKQPMSPSLVNINDTIAGMVNMLSRLIGGRVSLSWSADPDLGRVFVDPAQVDQILANLCVNARDAIEDRGTVNIATANVVVDQEFALELGDCEPGHYVCMSVTDSGFGMSDEVINHIFEPFFTTKGVGMGTGLGLATVYGIVKQNKGGIRVESEIGVGTRFEVYLPMDLDSGLGDDEEFEMAERSRPRLFSKILLVDDEPMLLKVTSRMLEGLGHDVFAALGPDEAIRVARELDHIDVLLTDVIMPGMNGKQLSDALLLEHPEMTVVFMSGYTAEVLEDEGFFSDAYFLQKPFSLRELNEIVIEALNIA